MKAIFFILLIVSIQLLREVPTGNFLFIFFFLSLSIFYLHINQYISFLHIYHLSIIDRQIGCMGYTSQIIG